VPFFDPSLALQKSGLVTGHPSRLQERLIATLQLDSGCQTPVVESSPRASEGTTPTSRPADGDEVPQLRAQRTLSSSSLQSYGLSEESNNSLDKKVGDDAAEVAVELKAAKSLLEIYKQRSGDLVHANEDLRNQLMALQMENATLKVQNEELKSRNEALIKTNQPQAQISGNSSPAVQAEQDLIDK
jgi:hypothetical protein